jgi:hypothetical protein
MSDGDRTVCLTCAKGRGRLGDGEDPANGVV